MNSVSAFCIPENNESKETQLLRMEVLDRFNYRIQDYRYDETLEYLLKTYSIYIKDYFRGKHFKNVLRKIKKDKNLLFVNRQYDGFGGTNRWVEIMLCK